MQDKFNKQPAARADEPLEHGEAIAVDPQGTLKAALADAQQQAAESRDAYLRMAAEMDNLRKRSQRDLENAYKFALERFLTELLPVQDSLEMGIAAADTTEAGIREGLRMTLKLLIAALDQAGVSEVEPARGAAFNPELHDAMTLQESTEVAPGTVLQTVQKGFQLNGRLLRAARVIVAKAPGAGA